VSRTRSDAYLSLDLAELSIPLAVLQTYIVNKSPCLIFAAINLESFTCKVRMIYSAGGVQVGKISGACGADFRMTIPHLRPVQSVKSLLQVLRLIDGTVCDKCVWTDSDDNKKRCSPCRHVRVTHFVLLFLDARRPDIP